MTFETGGGEDCANANVVFWPVATNFSLGPDVGFRGEAEVGQAAEPAASVENDLGRVKTKSDLVVVPSGRQIFAFFYSPRDRRAQNSGCGYTA